MHFFIAHFFRDIFVNKKLQPFHLQTKNDIYEQEKIILDLKTFLYLTTISQKNLKFLRNSLLSFFPIFFKRIYRSIIIAIG